MAVLTPQQRKKEIRDIEKNAERYGTSPKPEELISRLGEVIDQVMIEL